jgi:hypothetical protein
LIFFFSTTFLPYYFVIRIIFGSFEKENKGKLFKHLVPLIPYLAWLVSLYFRRDDLGLGNLVYEPIALLLAPTIFYILQKNVFKKTKGKYFYWFILIVISVFVFVIFSMLPRNGDWL